MHPIELHDNYSKYRRVTKYRKIQRLCYALTDYFYLIMKHFFPDGSGFFQDIYVPIHRA